MKKTLIALLALTGVAVAAEQPIWDSTVTSTQNTYTFNTTLDSFSIAVTLDVAILQSESGSNFNGSAKIINLTGTWEPSGASGTLDINVNGSSSAKTSTLYVGSTAPSGSYASNYSLTGISGTNIFTSSTDWSSIDAASLVLVKDGSGNNDAVYTYLTLKGTDGNLTVYSGGNTGIAFTHNSVYNTNIDVATVSFENSFATHAQVYSAALDADAAKAVGQSLVSTSVPEPATATLSLLALAGLAARRRRK